MIQELSVENLAIIDRSNVQFKSGFTAITGETGAGKSLLIDSIGLALGGRADSSLVRSGANKATICLVVDLRSNLPAVAKCAQLGVDLEEGILVVQREISIEGRSTVRLNGRPSTVSTLKEIGALIVDLHGQHEHQALLDPEKQILFLDQWIGQPISMLLADLFDQFSLLQNLKRRLSSIRSGQREREQRIDMLNFQIAEISEAAPCPGESEDISNRLHRLQFAEKLGRTTMACLESLSDDEDSAIVRLSTSIRELENCVAFDASLEQLLEPLRTADALLNESSRSIRTYTHNLEDDPSLLQETADRQDVLSKLKRKYGDTEGAILEFLKNAEQELNDLTCLTHDEGQLDAEIALQSAIVESLAEKITSLRKSKAQEFQKTITQQIRELAMPKAEFKIRFTKTALQESGQDHIEFDFSSNPGEPLKPMSKVASGGELSRIMLAIKVASAGRAGVPSLIFDEIDSGLSGRAAAVTAKKIEEIAKNYQVIVISHLPQMAGRAQNHFQIEKVQIGQRSQTQIRSLSSEERIAEIARMLAGEEVGDSAIANARDLLRRPA